MNLSLRDLLRAHHPIAHFIQDALVLGRSPDLHQRLRGGHRAARWWCGRTAGACRSGPGSASGRGGGWASGRSKFGNALGASDSDAVNLAGKSDLQNRWSAPASAATPAGWGAPPGWSEAEHLFFLCSDYGIAQFFDDFQRERKYARMVEVLALLHFTFAVLEAWAEKYHAPLGVLDVLVKALNVSSEGQKVRPPRGAAPHPASR